MATPNYKGQGQPTATSGGWLSGWFGSTPAYKSAPSAPASTPSTPSTTGQSAAASTAGAATTSATASAAAPSAAAMGCDANGPTQFAIVIPREVREVIER